MNRRLTSVIATRHFAPTAAAANQLLAEGAPADQVFLTGNTIIDALQQIRASETFHRTPLPLRVADGRRIVVVTLHRREHWGATLEEMCRALAALVERFVDVELVFPVHINPAVRTAVGPILGGRERVTLLEPLDYVTFLKLLDASWLVFTDSGGVQEEAPALGKPVLVLRETTERPEAIDAGVSRLVGTRFEQIVAAGEELLGNPRVRDRMAQIISPFGDGHAARRIADIMTAQPTPVAAISMV